MQHLTTSPPGGQAVDNWPVDWQKCGWNRCLESTAQTLLALASYVRSKGPGELINAEHLVALSAELDKTRNELLSAPVAQAQTLVQEVLAWRLMHPREKFVAGLGITTTSERD